MTKQESKAIAHQLVKLIEEVNAIEKDEKKRENIMYYCRKIKDIIKN